MDLAQRHARRRRDPPVQGADAHQAKGRLRPRSELTISEQPPLQPDGPRLEDFPSPTARAHHYVPEFYLAGFTRSGLRDDSLWVLDRRHDRSWRTKPANLAHERDFYRVDLEGVRPDAVERALGDLEGRAAEVLRAINRDRKLPTGDDFNTLLSFVALQVTRVPQFREMYERNAVHSCKSMLAFALSTPEFFESLSETTRLEGRDVPASITREGLLAFLEDESRYTMEIPREMAIQNMADMAGHLGPVLAQRHWSLLVAQDDRDDFICSDRPVILVPTRADVGPFLGFGMRDTEVIMPLNRQIGLVGHYDYEAVVFPADRAIVGMLNQQLLDYSERFIYSARESFPRTVVQKREPA